MRTLTLARRLLPALGAGALLISAVACGDSTTTDAAPELDSRQPARQPAGGIWAGNVVVEALPGAVRAGNNTTRPVGYVVFARDILPVITWRPCTERTGCPTIAPGERRTIPAADIPGMESGKGEVVFYWWHLVEGRDGRLEPDSVREVATKL